MSTDVGTPSLSIPATVAFYETRIIRLMENEARLERELSALRATHEAAQAEIAALREDAERYRRIKQDHEIPWTYDVPDTVAGRFYVMYGGDPVGCLEGELDAAIDAARKAK